MWLWILHVGCKKSLEFEISLEKWNVFVIEEFSSETLVLWKRWSNLCTRSTSSFCRNPFNFCTHVMWVKWWYHAKFQSFQLYGHLANEVRKCLKFKNVALFLLLLRGKPRTWWHGGGDAANLKHSTSQHRKPRTFYCKT